MPAELQVATIDDVARPCFRESPSVPVLQADRHSPCSPTHPSIDPAHRPMAAASGAPDSGELDAAAVQQVVLRLAAPDQSSHDAVTALLSHLEVYAAGDARRAAARQLIVAGALPPLVGYATMHWRGAWPRTGGRRVLPCGSPPCWCTH